MRSIRRSDDLCRQRGKFAGRACLLLPVLRRRARRRRGHRWRCLAPAAARSAGTGRQPSRPTMGEGAPLICPTVATRHGFVPYRGGSGGGLGVQPIARRLPQSTIGGTMMANTPIGGASLSGAMGGDRRSGMGMGTGPGRGMLVPFGYEGGIGMGGMSSMSGGMGDRRMPTSTGPGFGYPFRVPMSLGGSSSMAMP